jgi:hypothetical protein
MSNFFNAAAKNLFPIITMIAMNILSKILNIAYEAFWLTMFEAIQEAEKKLKGAYLKRDAVVAQMLDFIKKHKKLSFVQEFAVKLFIGRVIDLIILEINSADGEGKAWLNIIKDIEERINKKLDIIDPLQLEKV